MAKGRYMPADNPDRVRRDLQIVRLSEQGLSASEIAPQVGISRPRVSQILSDERAKELIEQSVKMHLVADQAIRRRHIGLCFNLDAKVSLDAIKEHNKIIGITPSHAPSTVIQQLFMSGQGGLDAETKALLVQALGLEDVS